MYQHTNSKGITYHLNARTITLHSGKEQTIYYFSKDARPETGADLPEDRTVSETPYGLPVLKKKA